MAFTIKITVTADDIAKGSRFQCDRCPVALAIARIMGGKKVYISTDCARIGTKRYSLPSVAADWIGRFDSAYPVQPFAFHLKKS